MWNLTSARLLSAVRRFLRLQRQPRPKPCGKCRSMGKTTIGGSACPACIPVCSGKPALLTRTVHQGFELTDEIASWVRGDPLADISRGRFSHLLQVHAIFPCSVHRFVEKFNRWSLS